jgi:hypothetical protein
LIRHLARMTRDRRCAEGCFQAFPFTARGEDARAIARRTLTILYTTLPPNTIVIGIDRRRNQLLLHLLEPAPLPDTVRRLETRA